MHAQGHVLARVSLGVSPRAPLPGFTGLGFEVQGIGFRNDGPCCASNPSIMGLLVALLGNACTRACSLLGFHYGVSPGAPIPGFRV
jgi:hypothetical protein